ncbi:retropepsin-like aspartic protease family protein [Natronospira bacteriovora]|uniref:TIGR02281 family clan AA aspartic protease n=1 Tax=Natronospira bacteriovora TaxID=3069753 RepID=A0ABU0W5Q5_9GAMM|nr:TIGR02281 family clan AA aspartic protease [Natronospira sp. AB-CW4]MDQ2069363.1 TIGR02281 family clan AA aspartic protease [Natronospira sp. AB-CW4]
MSAANENRMAMVMALLAFLTLLGVLTLAFEGVLDDREHPNRQVGATAVNDQQLELRLQRNRQGHYLAEGEINGYPVTFLLDTGATTISVPGHLADRIGLERGHIIPTLTAGGRVNSYATRLNVNLGGIRQDDIRASINPAMDMDKVLLGMNFLGPLELEQRDGVLVLRTPQ